MDLWGAVAIVGLLIFLAGAIAGLIGIYQSFK